MSVRLLLGALTAKKKLIQSSMTVSNLSKQN